MTRLAYTVLPAREQPGRAVFAVAAILLVEGILLFGEKSLFFAALGGFILLASISSFLFPTTVEIDEAGVRTRHLGALKARPWEQLRRASLRKGGVLLSPFVRPSVLDGPRGIFLLFGTPAEREALLERVREKLPCS